MSKTIAIAGMGWLGKPFAQKLMILGYTVKGSVTTVKKATQLQSSGFNAYPLQITEEGVIGEPQGFLKAVSVLVIMIPPGIRRNTGTDYVLKMSYFLSEIERSDVKKVILISSTSVYGDAQGMVTEHDIPKSSSTSGKQLFQVEQLFFNASFIDASIVRFGGLYGGSRQPVTYLAGRKNLSNGDAPVNMIHREDCIGILVDIIKTEAFGQIFNAVHPAHPSKREYYTAKALALNLTPPTYSIDQATTPSKQVDSIHLDTLLSYEFKKDL